VSKTDPTVTDEFTKKGLAIGRGLSHPLAARHQRAGAPGEYTRRAGISAQRQRTGVRIPGPVVLDRRAWRRHAFQPRLSHAEWVRGSTAKRARCSTHSARDTSCKQGRPSQA